ncbi:MAG: PilZ domain-containing protein [Planctomycetota bacterium]
MRSTVRLKAGTQSGTVVLRRVNTPMIICDLQDISEMGCRCMARVRINDWSDSEKWRALLRTGELYEAEITFDPYIPFIRLPIEIRSSIAIPSDGYELGFAFFDLEPDHRQMLNQAMISIATEKIRNSKSLLKRENQTDSPDYASASAPVTPVQMRARLSAFTKPMEKPADILNGVETKAIAQQAEMDSRPARPEPKLGEVLKRNSVLSKGEIANAVFSAREKGQKLGEYLVREGVLTPLQVLQARSAQTGLAYVDFDMSNIPMSLLDLFPFSKMKRFEFVPFESEGELVRLACANPIGKMDLDSLQRISGKRLECYLCREDLPREFLDGVVRRFDRYRRSQTRFKVSLPASFQCYTPEGPMLTEATFRGRTIDISEGGMQVVGPVILGLDPDALGPGQVKMMVTVGAIPHDIVAVCDTRHVRFMRNSGGSTTCVYGLKVDEMSESHRDVLQGLIARVTRSNDDEEGVEMATPIYDDDM